MSMKELFTVFFFIALSLNAFTQVTGGSTAGTTPGTTGTVPGTTDTIPGTTGTTPGTTGTIPGTTRMPPATTQLPPPTTQFPNPTTQFPNPTTQMPNPTTQLPPLTTQTPPATTSNIPGTTDFEDGTSITGRFDGADESANIFDTLDNNTGLTGGAGNLTNNGFGNNQRTLRGELDNNTNVLGNESVSNEENDSFATGPDTPDTLNNGIFGNDTETPMDDTVSE